MSRRYFPHHEISGFAHGALGFGFPLVATPLVDLVVDMNS